MGSARAEEKKRREEQTRQDKAKADKRRKDKTKAEKRKAEQLKQSAEITHQQNSRTADGGVRAAAMPRDNSRAKQSPPRKLVTAVGEHKRYVLYKVGKVLVASH